MIVIQEDGNFFGETKVLGIGNAKPELKYGKVAKKLREYELEKYCKKLDEIDGKIKMLNENFNLQEEFNKRVEGLKEGNLFRTKQLSNFMKFYNIL